MELKRAGAKIYIGTGRDGREEYGPNGVQGSMHMKALVLDSRVAWTGSANWTRNSKTNFELVFRMVGPPVGSIKAAILNALEGASEL